MSTCRVISCVVGRGCLLSLGKSLLVFALLHFVLQGQTCLLFQVSLDFLLLHSRPQWWKGHLFRVLVLEDLVGLHRTIQLQLQHYWSGQKKASLFGIISRRSLFLEWSNQSILKEISSEYALEGLMLTLKLQYFGRLMRRTDSLEKTLILGQNEDMGRRWW